MKNISMDNMTELNELIYVRAKLDYEKRKQKQKS